MSQYGFIDLFKLKASLLTIMPLFSPTTNTTPLVHSVIGIVYVISTSD